MTDHPTRRTLFRLAGGGVAALALLPLLRRRAGGAPGASARARRLLILHQAGGIRSSAAFLASAETRLNPYGLIAGTGTPFALGRLLDDTRPGEPALPDADYLLGPAWAGALVPRLREVGDRFSVLGTWSIGRGEHATARIEEPSGDASGAAPGLLTRVGAALAEAAGTDLEVPAFHLSPAARFGGGDGAMSRHVPVSLASWQSLPSEADADPYAELVTGSGWAADDAMRERFDRRRLASRGGLGRQLVDTVAAHHRGARTIGQRLAEADLAVGHELAGAAALGTVRLDGGPVPLTNAMLHELFTRCLGPDPEGDGKYYDRAVDAALAVRLLQLGSPAVTLEISNFDWHGGERQDAPRLYGFFGRLWATLAWLLPRIDDPSGEGSLLDRTLVTTMSDFGRDPGGATGWNGGEGTDHGADPACFYLAHAVMGAGVAGGRLIGGVRTDTYDARTEAVQHTPVQLLATQLAALGLDPFDDDYGLPLAGRTIEELWT